MKINRLIIVLCAVMAAYFAASAQNSTVSPYSRFGYGILSEQANTMQKGMGGTGYAMRSGRQINFMNPASYAAIDTLTFLFDMGLDAKWLNSSQGNDHGKNFTGGLNYLILQFPITKYGSGAVGLMPYSEVGYSFEKQIENGVSSYQGDGAINQAVVGLSARPFKGFTLGANFSYLFGTTTNSIYITSESSQQSLFERRIEVRDYNMRFGMQYGFTVGEHQTTFGVVYSPRKSFHGHTYGEKSDITADAAPTVVGDTITLKGNAIQPEYYGAGINYQWGNRLMLEADFTFQPWQGSKFATIDGFDSSTTSFNDMWRVNVGAQYIYKPRGNWWQRINYRAGLSYRHDYIRIGDNSLREIGASIGVGIPAPLTKTMVNLAVEYRNRQAQPTSLVTENYFVVTLGVNFNELWFWRNKIR